MADIVARNMVLSQSFGNLRDDVAMLPTKSYGAIQLPAPEFGCKCQLRHCASPKIQRLQACGLVPHTSGTAVKPSAALRAGDVLGAGVSRMAASTIVPLLRTRALYMCH